MYLWNHSQTKMQLDFEYEDIYERSMETGKISGRDFTKWSNWTRFNMMLSDKGRAGVYEFTNEDFVSRIKMYFPLDYDDFNRLRIKICKLLKIQNFDTFPSSMDIFIVFIFHTTLYH